MTTLPPEDGQAGPETGATGQQPEQPQQPEAQQPEQPFTPPQPPQAQPQYEAPQPPQAPQPQYQQAPPGGYQQPSASGYQQPPAGGYQQPPAGGYQQAPAADPVSNITLNYWLSVFFVWLPALIFFLIEKDKGNPQAYAYHRDNLNFSLVRTIAYVGIVVVGWIPYIGWLIAVLLWLAQIVLFVFHIMAAVKAPEGYRRGEQPGFIFNIPMVK